MWNLPAHRGLAVPTSSPSTTGSSHHTRKSTCNKFDVYAEIQADVGKVSDAEIMRRLDATKLIRRNFVRVSVLLDSYTSIEFEENPAMTVDSLTSSVGGTLHLWLGMTITFVVEIVDLLYNVLLSIYSYIKKVYCVNRNQ